ncbi:MAG: hypothetical protein JO199_09580, partial [Candidatus Eremiobacteraeota bacterium]|nr:hypothetical protein [Candidatus Eremiobacteraeota bacterium]
MYVGRADYAGDCFLLAETAPVPSSAFWYGGAEIEYDFGTRPIKIYHAPFTGGGITFSPYLVVLTKSKPSRTIVMTTKYE